MATMKLSPFIASVDPRQEFDPDRHVALGDMFNNILAVICSWGVRLKINLIPVGIEPLEVSRNRQKKH